MKIGSLFSGIGGLELGLERAGLGDIAWQVEIDPFCRAILSKHWPDAERAIDVRTFVPSLFEPVDLICGGFPCQDVSQAARGRNEGIEGEQSGLWKEFARIVEEATPKVVVVENVASGFNRWWPTVKKDLRTRGYSPRPFAISARDVGARHLRERIFVVAYSNRHRELPVPKYEKVARPKENAARSWNGWDAAPGDLRMDDGVPRGLDRIVALGNAVVPQCAEAVGRMIREELLLQDCLYGQP